MELIGQNRVKASLEQMVALDKVGHGYLFYGPAGIGKFTVASLFAEKFLDERARTSDLIVLDYGEKLIPVDAIREMQSQVSIRPMYSAKKVFIIRNSDNMSIQAQNALLKTLEEPPSYALIILTANNPLKLRDTIRSRLFAIELEGYSLDQCFQIIKSKGIEKSDESIGYAIKLAQCVPGKAIGWLENEENERLRSDIFDVFKSPFNINLVGIKLFNVLSVDKESGLMGIELLQLLFRDVLRYKTTKQTEHLINEDKSFIIIDMDIKFKVDGLVRILQYLEQAYSSIIGNVNFEACINRLTLKIQEEII